jgi:hypothetical protein
LFIDIVGYSKLLIDDQRELQQQLNQIVRNTESHPLHGNPRLEKKCRRPLRTAWAKVGTFLQSASG